MYLYELKITENGIIFYDEVWADNGRDALETGEMKYPKADYVELS
jgi:hypothetical protein